MIAVVRIWDGDPTIEQLVAFSVQIFKVFLRSRGSVLGIAGHRSG
jgi:hypothetical protein